MADNSTSSRSLILSIATEMNKTPDQMEKFITALEDNFIDNVGAMKECSDQDFKDMGFPLGLINKIKKRFEAPASSGPVLNLNAPAAGNT